MKIVNILTLFVLFVFTESLFARNCHLEEEQCQFTFAKMLSQSERVFLKDLRGNDCYAQPDLLVVCGVGDTIPILLYTKSVEPIYDITLNVEFDEGLEYATFAYVHDPFDTNNADLDTISVVNPESVSFRITELDQAGGAAVVYVGVRAACGVNFDLAQSGITYTLSYNNGTEDCTEAIKPDQNYATNVLTPGIQFIGNSTPDNANFVDFNTDNCVTTTVTGLSPVAGLTEASLRVRDYGFDSGVTLGTIRVNGETVPVNAVAIDGTTGVATVLLDGNNNPNYWSADGQLLLTESIPIEVCFQTNACIGEEFVPRFSILSTCGGTYCNGEEDTEGTTTIRERYTFNPTATVTFNDLQEPSFCSPTEPVPYIYETSIISDLADPVRGDFHSIFHLLDACPASFLSIDTVYIIDGAGGAVIAGVPREGTQTTFYQNTDGRVIVDFRRLLAGVDLDGAGGLEDIDGDGIFDDLPAGEQLFLRVELLPSCSPELLSCGLSSDATCDITRALWGVYRNCGRNLFYPDVAIDDGIPAYTNESEGMFDNLETFEQNQITYQGYYYDDAHSPTNPQTENIQFSYVLGMNDFATCPSTGAIKLQLYFSGQDSLMQDLEVSNINFNGSSVSIKSDVLGEGERRIFINAGDNTPALSHSYTFDITFDNDYCSTRRLVNLQAIIMQECDGCDCTLAKACAVSVLSVDPANPPQSCVDGENYAEIRRISTGYTDRDKSTHLRPEEVDNDDVTRFLPGDTMEISGWITVYNAEEWNISNRSLDFQLLHLQNGSASRPLLTSRMDNANLRLHRFELKRESTGDLFDLGAIPFSGDFNNNSNNSSGAWVVERRNAPHDPTINHPAILNSQYVKGAAGFNSTNDYNDGYLGRVYFGLGAQIPGDQPSVQEFFDYIGGGFQTNDTVFMTWRVPIKSIPRILNTGTPTINGAEIDNGSFRIDVDGRSWNGSLSSGNIGTINNEADYQYHEPYIRSERYIEYSNDGCDAELVQTFHLADPPPADWYENEFRPIIGIEQLQIDVPSDYVYVGGAYIQHYDQAAQALQVDSVENLIAVDIDGSEGFISCEPKGTLFFIDEETKDGLRADDYIGLDAGDDDISLTGGTFPMLGVGLNPTGTLPNDSITFRIPLVRSCGDAPTGTSLESVYSASYSYLPDYDIRTYTCNRGQWFTNTPTSSDYCGDNGIDSRYWPYNRDDDDNPHHVANDSTFTLDVRGTTSSLSYSTPQFTPASPIIDGGGSETTNYSVSFDQAIPFGTMVVTVSQAVDLQMVNGVVPTQVGSTDSTKIFIYDMGSQPMGNYSVDLVTDLIYCDEAEICVQHLFCNPINAPEVAQALSKSGKICEEACFKYVSGLPEMQVNYQFDNNEELCSVEDYNILYSNIGSTDFEDFFPTIYLPEGMVFVPGSWTYAVSGGAAISIGNPTENTNKTGVNGTAYEWAANTFPDVLDGTTLAISFTGSTTCNSVIGMPMVTEVNAGVACNQTFASNVYRSTPINVATPPDPTPSFSFSEDDAKVNCAGETSVTITALNTGKAFYSPSRVCMIIPSGITITASDVEFLAPLGASVDNFTSEAVGTGGASKVCFDSPATAIGGFFCMNLNFLADLECGNVDIAFLIQRTITLTCSTTGEVCDVQAVAAPNQFLTLEVVPGVALSAEPTVAAACSATPGSIDIAYDLPLENPDPVAYSDNITVELYYDLDGNQDLGNVDPLLGSENVSINIAPNGTQTIAGVLTVPADQGCGLIIRASVPGCTCGEIIVPVPEVLPDYIQNLGQAISLCPGKTYDIEVPCGTPTYTFDPPEAGTASFAGTTLTIGLNAGFGVIAPVMFTMSSSIGSCEGQETQMSISQVEDFNFGDFTFYTCTEGCFQFDLGIPLNLTEDLEISISPTTFLEDATSSEPVFCNATANTSYTIDFMLNGQCMSSSNLELIVAAPPEITLVPPPVECNATGFELSSLASFTPNSLDGLWESQGDGTFDLGRNFSANGQYLPGLTDLDSGYVMLVLRSDRLNETNGGIVQSPCASAIDRFRVPLFECDYGDLPDSGNGNGSGNYSTTEDDNGPSHVLVDGLFLGTTVDSDPDGQQDAAAQGDAGNDEDGLTLPSTIFVSQDFILPVSITNTTGMTAYLRVWIDWNADGDFDNSNELVISDTDEAGSFLGTYNLTVPSNVATGNLLGVRARLSHQSGLAPTGFSTSGEVEDYLLQAVEVDFADFAATCAESPCHVRNDDIYFGSGVTSDSSPNQNATADADVDDAFILANTFNIRPGIIIRLPLTVFNNTGQTAFLAAWADWNDDGDFEDAGEQLTNNSYDPAVFNGSFTAPLSVTVPANVVQDEPIALRFRLSTSNEIFTTPCGDGNCAPDGEVEDFLIQVSCKPNICHPIQITINRG